MIEDNRTKVYVCITKRGNTYRLSEEKKGRNKITERMMNPNKKWAKGDGYKVVKDIKFRYRERIEVPAQLNFTLNQQQYDYMVSSASRPYDKFKEWERMSAKERLECHLDAICHDYGGYEYTYELVP